MSDDHLTVAQSIIDAHINERIRPHVIRCTSPEDGREVRDDQAGGGACFSLAKVADNPDDEHDGIDSTLVNHVSSECDPGRGSGPLPNLVFDEAIDDKADYNETKMILSFHVEGKTVFSAASIALAYDADVKLLYLSMSKTAPSHRRQGLNKLLSQAVVLISIASKKPVALKAASRYTVLSAIDSGFIFDTECRYPICKQIHFKDDGAYEVVPEYAGDEYCYTYFNWADQGVTFTDFKNDANYLNTLIKAAVLDGTLSRERRQSGHVLSSTELLKVLSEKMFLSEPVGYDFDARSNQLPMIFYPESTPFCFVLNNIATQSRAVATKLGEKSDADDTPRVKPRGRAGSFLTPTVFHFPFNRGGPRLPPLPPSGATTARGGGGGATLYLALFASASVLVVSTLVGASG